MDLEQEINQLQKYIRELKQEIKDLHEQLSFLKSKDQQIKPLPEYNPNQYNFPFWHDETSGNRPLQLPTSSINERYKPLAIDLHNGQYEDGNGY